MKEQALFCDGTASYVNPPQPAENETITLRFRTAKDDVDRVRLMTGVGGYDMKKESTRGEFDYYTINWRLNEEPFRYCFEIQDGDELCYYNKCGTSKEIVAFYEFVIVPGFSTPDWAKGAVMYQIFTDRFYNGDKTNDVESREYFYIGDYSRKVTDWNKYPDKMGVREFYGGDLQGVIDKLDYLQDLGVEVLYFNPLFVSPSNHKYDIQDYDYIDPHYGVI
ncbi:MAG: alpha amylase N-terminal ig-like domain-containing protein, partial [[Clostridium] scindens]